jgi:hypothetical protein
MGKANSPARIQLVVFGIDISNFLPVGFDLLFVLWAAYTS